MRKTILAAAFLIPAFASAAPSLAQEKVAMKCPVGGAAFDYVRPAPKAVLGLRPDGRPYGESAQPAPLPECPDNGLVLYKDYEPDEIEKLTAFVASDGYEALRGEDTQYYRAYKLMRELGETPDDYLWALLQATWEADGKPGLRKRYQEELVSASSDVPARTGDMTWIGLEGRVIDALRELGRFDEASAKLAKIPMLWLDVQIPSADTASREEILAAKQKRVWLLYFRQEQAAIERKDSAREPLDMLPRAIATARCTAEAGKLGEFDRAFCSGTLAKAATPGVKPGAAPTEAEIEALRKKREDSGR
jgi:hypothetical protein